MSKNLTRKGLAFGAVVALGTTLFAGAPASAAGIDNASVSLAPLTGTEYNVLTQNTFDLKSNYASALVGAGKKLKFKVEDSAAKTRADIDNNGTTADVNGAKSVTAWSRSGGAVGSVTVTITSAAHGFKVGDSLTIAGLTDSDGTSDSTFLALVNTTQTVATVADADTFTFTITNATASTLTAGVNSATATGVLSNAGTSVLNPRSDLIAREVGSVNIVGTTAGTVSARAADNSYVVAGIANSNAADQVLRLVSTDADATVTAVVTAWVDDNDNGLIDTTEYQSPARTVKFLATSDIVPTVTLNPITTGTESLIAKISTVPVLNGQQVGDKLGAVFTRQDSSKSVAVISSSNWNDTTKLWTITKSLLSSDTVGAPYDTTSDVNNDGAWTGLTTAPADADVTEASSSVASKVLTITSSATHNLRVGDKVTIAGATDTGNNGEKTVTSVPSTTTFTVATTGADATTLAGTVSYTVTTYAGNKSLVDRAFPGTYTATAAILLAADFGQTTPNELTKLGAAVSNAAAAKTATSISVDVAGSANDAKTGADSSEVRVGTTSAVVVATAKNVDGDPVGAGVVVSATVSSVPTGTGTFSVNGTTATNGVVVYANTDANGQAKFTVGSTTAVAGNAISFNFTAEGLANVSETLTWANAVYSIVDLADTASASSPSRLRSANKGAATVFDLVVQDQFKTVADSAAYRLKVASTGRTVFTQYYSLTAGKVQVSVADGQVDLTADTTVAVSIEKLTSGAWAALADEKGVIWGTDASGTGSELGTVAIKYYDQTDAIALNADAATTPNSTAAELTPATTTKALTAIDLRTASGSAPAYAGGTGNGKITGILKNSATAVGRQGAVVTASGSGLLFNAGDVWSIGSVSTLTDASGLFTINVYSNNPGIKTVTITSGAVSTTVKVTYTGASSAARTLTISGAQKVASGSTLQANILLVDGNGNGVDTTAPATTPAAEYIKVSYDGPGLLSGSALPVETDEDGKASVRYLLGTGDKGTATVTVKFDKNFDGDFLDATDITVVRNYVIGVSAKITKAATSSAVVKNAAGATVKIVRGTKSKTVTATSNSQKISVKGGSGTVKVYVNGVKVASK